MSAPIIFDNRARVRGQTTPKLLIRFRDDVINLKPSVVIFLAGINDIAGNTGPSTIGMTTNNVMSMSELAKAHDIKVNFVFGLIKASTILLAFDF